MAFMLTPALNETYFTGGYQITVDSKKVKTPAGRPLVVPNKTLAMAVSVEWDSQVDTIKPANMHLVCAVVTLKQICVCYIKYIQILYTISSKKRG